MKDSIDVQTDSLSLAALKYGQYKNAYHAALEDQKYLKRGGLEVKILARAFREFTNLQVVNIDDHNDRIGFRQLFRDFGAFRAEDLLTCNGTNTVPPLIKALSEAGVQLSVLRIGSHYELRSYDTPNIHLMGGFLSFPKRLCSDAMTKAFNDSRNLIHAVRVLSQLRTLEISNLAVKDDRSDLLKMASAMKNAIGHSRELKTVTVMEIESSTFFNNMRPFYLSLEHLFSVQPGLKTITVVTLHNLAINNHANLVSFIRLHASILEEVFFHFFILLEDVK